MGSSLNHAKYADVAASTSAQPGQVPVSALSHIMTGPEQSRVPLFQRHYRSGEKIDVPNTRANAYASDRSSDRLCYYGVAERGARRSRSRPRRVSSDSFS